MVGFAVGSDFLAEFPRFFLEGREFDADEFCGFFRGEGFDGVDLGSEDGDVFGFDRGIREKMLTAVYSFAERLMV